MNDRMEEIKDRFYGKVRLVINSFPPILQDTHTHINTYTLKTIFHKLHYN